LPAAFFVSGWRPAGRPGEPQERPEGSTGFPRARWFKKKGFLPDFLGDLS